MAVERDLYGDLRRRMIEQSAAERSRVDGGAAVGLMLAAVCGFVWGGLLMLVLWVVLG